MTDIRVLLVDDHRVFTELLGFALDSRAGVRCVGRARSSAAALELASTTPFDVAIVDVHLLDGDGITLTTALRARRPGARFIVLTAFPTAELSTAAAAAGVPLLAKDGTLEAIMAEILGEAGSAVDEFPVDPLTRREHEVLELLAEGLDAVSISRVLLVSVHTVRGHVKALLQKTRARSQLEAVVTAQRAGILPAPIRRSELAASVR